MTRRRNRELDPAGFDIWTFPPTPARMAAWTLGGIAAAWIAAILGILTVITRLGDDD